MTPVLSIIVPVYNTKQYLSRCIESILGQSFQDFELLLIDDGSTDGSGDVCDLYSARDSRVRVFHKQNGGASSARNMGLDMIKGEWVTFIDSDDYVLDDFFTIPFENSIDLFMQNWKYASGSAKEFFPSKIVLKKEYCEFLKENIQSDLFRTACCSFFKRSILFDNDIRFDLRFRLGEDTLFVLDYYKYAGSILIMDNSCYIYNRQENWDDKYRLSWSDARAYLCSFMDKYNALPIESPQLLVFMFNFVYKRIKGNGILLRFKWRLSKPVLQYKELSLPTKSKLYQTKFYIAKALSTILYG